jgi:hypothetical protein
MTKISGTVTRSDLEGGMWTLETDKGDRYQLTGELSGLADGMKAELQGKVQKDQMGFGMSGALFTVTSVKALDGVGDGGC